MGNGQGNGSECAFPFAEDHESANSFGLTKREAIAKDLPHIEVEFGDLGIMCKFIGVDTVPESIDEILSVTFATEAKIRVMRADALLKELDK